MSFADPRLKIRLLKDSVMCPPSASWYGCGLGGTRQLAMPLGGMVSCLQNLPLQQHFIQCVWLFVTRQVVTQEDIDALTCALSMVAIVIGSAMLSILQSVCLKGNHLLVLHQK